MDPAQRIPGITNTARSVQVNLMRSRISRRNGLVGCRADVSPFGTNTKTSPAELKNVTASMYSVALGPTADTKQACYGGPQHKGKSWCQSKACIANVLDGSSTFRYLGEQAEVCSSPKQSPLAGF